MQGREQGVWEQAVTHYDYTVSHEIARFNAFEMLLLSVSLYQQSPIRQAETQANTNTYDTNKHTCTHTCKHTRTHIHTYLLQPCPVLQC